LGFFGLRACRGRVHDPPPGGNLSRNSSGSPPPAPLAFDQGRGGLQKRTDKMLRLKENTRHAPFAPVLFMEGEGSHIDGFSHCRNSPPRIPERRDIHPPYHKNVGQEWGKKCFR